MKKVTVQYTCDFCKSANKGNLAWRFDGDLVDIIMSVNGIDLDLCPGCWHAIHKALLERIQGKD